MADPVSAPGVVQADSLAAISPRGWKRILIATWKDGGENNLGLLSAGVAFYAFLAFVPLLTAFVLSYGLVADPVSVVSHMQALTSVMPPDAAGIVGDQLKSMAETGDAETGFALLLALGIAVYGASQGATAIMTALNIVYEVGESRGFIRRTSIALAMSVGMVLVLFVAILAISALNLLESLLPDLGGPAGLLLKTGFFGLAAGAVILLLAVVYRFAPNRPEADWRWITPGSALATIVWIAATWGFGLYVANFSNYNATYGSLGAVIVFLTWLYLTAYIVLFGAELNAVLELSAGPEKVRDQTATKGETEPVKRAPAATERAAAIPAREAETPSFARVVTRIGLFAMLLKLLGRGRPAGAPR